MLKCRVLLVENEDPKVLKCGHPGSALRSVTLPVSSLYIHKRSSPWCFAGCRGNREGIMEENHGSQE